MSEDELAVTGTGAPGGLASSSPAQSSEEDPKAEGKDGIRQTRICRELLSAANAKWKQEHMDEKFKRVVAMYQGQQDRSEKKKKGDAQIIEVNMLYPTSQISKSAMLVKAPRVSGRPRKESPEDKEVKACRLGAAILNYETEMNDYPDAFDWILTYANTFCYAVLKFGHDNNGLVWWEAPHPATVRIDPTLDKFKPEAGNWLCHIFECSVKTLRDSGIYDKKAVTALAKQLAEGREDFYEETYMVRIHEHYIKKSNGDIWLLAECKELSEPLRYSKMEGYTCFPLQFVYFNKPLRGIFPVCEALLYSDQVAEISFLRSKALIHASRASTRVVVDGQAFSPDELKKVKDNVDWNHLVTTGNVPVTQALYVVNPAESSSDIYTKQEMYARDDIFHITGISGESREIPQTGSKAATVAAIMQQKEAARQGDKERILRGFLVRAYRATLNLNQQFLKSELWVKITGEKYEKITSRDDIAGDYEIEVELSNELSKDQSLIITEATDLFTQALTLQSGGYLKGTGMMIDIKYAFKQLLAAYGRTDAELWFTKEPEPEPPPEELAPAGPPSLGGIDLNSLIGGPQGMPLPAPEQVLPQMPITPTGDPMQEALAAAEAIRAMGLAGTEGILPPG